MTPELKPCGHCGGEAALIKTQSGKHWNVRCLKCHIGTPAYPTLDIVDKEIQKEAIEVWNRVI